MSVSNFEEQVFTYLWRGLVLAGLVTVLWGILVPVSNDQTQGQAQGATNTASSRARGSSADNEAR
jgi:hypothetical protein